MTEDNGSYEKKKDVGESQKVRFFNVFLFVSLEISNDSSRSESCDDFGKKERIRRELSTNERTLERTFLMISSAIEGSPADHSRELVVIFMLDESKYRWLTDVYPPVINKEQFYKICHVSKRTALAYLEHGMIPCENTGKKTRKYSIKLMDVIRFLEARDNAPSGFVAPPGWYKGKTQDEVIILTPEIRLRLRTALEAMLETYPDVLSPQQVKEITGYTLSTVTKWCNSERLYHYRIQGKNLIPKIALLDFAISNDFQSIKVKSQKHLLLLAEELSMVIENPVENEGNKEQE